MRVRELSLWIVVALAAAFAVRALLPAVFPLFPRGWETTEGQARAIALASASKLGPVPAGALVSVDWAGDMALEAALLAAGPEARRQAAATPLLGALACWRVRVYAPGAAAGDWSYNGEVSSHGKVLTMLRKLGEEVPAAELAPAAALGRALATLRDQGLDPGAFAAPESRSQQRAHRTDLTLRFIAKQPLPGGIRHGVEVRFLGDRPGGFQLWSSAATETAMTQQIGPWFLVYFGIQLILFLLLLTLAIFFGRLYHAGEVGVHRALQLLSVVLVGGLIFQVVYMVPLAEDVFIGGLSRTIATWLILLLRIVFGVLPLGLLAALAWGVGESWARERWGTKLAGFEALFRGDWRNATVARASVRGIALGVALLAVLFAVSLPLQRLGAWPSASLQLLLAIGSSGWMGVGIVGRLLGSSLPALIVACLFLTTLPARRLPLTLATLVAGLASAAVVIPPFAPQPLSIGLPVWLLATATPVIVFIASDLLTALFCGLTAKAVMMCLPLLLAHSPRMQLDGYLPLLVLLLPLLFSVRHLLGGREVVYRWEDVPPHVRRIAERERQRVELETAREIQSSILPELPSQLGGVAIAYAYLPATEVGGDFYDVLALEDGRVAIAVGDVAGHGVSSGLVMSMVRSALAVQVTFDPEVASVFTTLNRMVYQSARRRLLTTLTYAILDPQRRELAYASAGHVFPYRVSREGGVYELEAGSYPLGVRAESAPAVRTERLAAGDHVVLLSDGIVEALRGGSDEPFGFTRLAQSLKRHAGGSPEALVRGVLSDLAVHTGAVPREDDMTILALRLPG